MYRQAKGGNPLNTEKVIGGSVSHVISQWLLGSLEEKQQLWQRNSPEIMRFQGSESFGDICLSHQEVLELVSN